MFLTPIQFSVMLYKTQIILTLTIYIHLKMLFVESEYKNLVRFNVSSEKFQKMDLPGCCAELFIRDTIARYATLNLFRPRQRLLRPAFYLNELYVYILK